MKPYGIAIAILLTGLGFACKSSKTNQEYLLLLALPVITEVSPQVGNPKFSTINETFEATDVKIKGRGFSSVIPDNIVKFNNIQATVFSASDTELLLRVPDGTTTGVLSYANAGKGGSCDSADGRSGNYCTSTDFYVNCYLPFKGRYGEVYLVNPGEKLKLKYKTDLDVKTFKTTFTTSVTISVTCKTEILVSYFSPSCGLTYINKLTPLTFQVDGNYTVQYFVTSATAGDCTIEAF